MAQAVIPVEAPTCFADKMLALNAATKSVNNQHGVGSMLLMGSREIVTMPSIPTGLMDLDYRVIGIGGLPRGRFTEIFGPESCGKTTLALSVVAQAQKLGGTAAYIDAEHALDPLYARALGVDVDNMYMSQPDYGEQALSIAEEIIETNACDVLVVDSVAALVPKAELDGEMEDQQMGLQARLMSKAMRKLVGITRQAGTVVIFINQIREKIGNSYGNPETTTGGKALRFYASLRIRMSQTGNPSTDGTSKNTHFKAVKNKCGTPFRETDVPVVFGKGFDGFASTIDLAIELKVIDQAGAWYSFMGERLGNGKEKASAFVQNTPPIYAAIQQGLREKLAA
jgi:recombination protein RecA